MALARSSGTPVYEMRVTLRPANVRMASGAGVASGCAGTKPGMKGWVDWMKTLAGFETGADALTGGAVAWAESCEAVKREKMHPSKTT